MSQQLAAVAAACCCPREPVPPCQPIHSSVVVRMSSVSVDLGCRDHIYQCGATDAQGNQFLCCCQSDTCFGFGFPCDSPAWDCRTLRLKGEVEPSFVMQMDTDNSYRTRIDCPNGLNEAYFGGVIDGEEPQCERIIWPNGGTHILYRQAYVGARSCVGTYMYPVPFGTCNTGCSLDASRTGFMVFARLMPFAGQVMHEGCASVVRKLHIGINLVSSQRYADFCKCEPGYRFVDILSADYSMEYYSYCCPDTPPQGVRGTYRAPQFLLDLASAPVTVQCGDKEIEITPVKWPATVVVE